MTEDYYKILEVEEGASVDEIKKSYRRLSMEYHPDKNLNDPVRSERFKNISTAYDTLGNVDKKKHYDMSRRGGNMRGFRGHSDIFDFVNQHFNVNVQRMVPPIDIMLEISIQKAFSGCNEPIQIKRIVREGDIQREEVETVYVPIPPGIDTNELIILKNKGHVGGGVVSDVRIRIHIKNESEFIRHGLDLVLLKKITLKEALCGFTLELKYLNGKTIRLNNDSGNIIASMSEIIVNDFGMRRGEHKGNLIVKFEIEMPSKLSSDQIEKIRDIL